MSTNVAHSYLLVGGSHLFHTDMHLRRTVNTFFLCGGGVGGGTCFSGL